MRNIDSLGQYGRRNGTDTPASPPNLSSTAWRIHWDYGVSNSTQAVTGYISRMVSVGDSASGGAAKMKILLCVCPALLATAASLTRQ